MEMWCEIGPTSQIMQVSFTLMRFITHIVNFIQRRGHFVKPWYEYKILEQSFVLSHFGNPELENNPMNCAVSSNISRHRITWFYWCLFISTMNIQLCRIWWHLVVGLQTANNWIPLVSLFPIWPLQLQTTWQPLYGASVACLSWASIDNLTTWWTKDILSL